MKTLSFILALASSPTLAQESIIGVNLLSLHDRPGYESFTPGVYYRAPSGAGGGLLQNSIGRVSLHAEWTVQTDPLWRGLRVGVTAGFITGYNAPYTRCGGSQCQTIKGAPPVQFFVMPSLLFAEHHRIIYIPRKPADEHSAQALSYAFEFKF